MADRIAILKVAKLLALSTSSNAGESESALDMAYKLYVREGVTFEDLIGLEQRLLYRTAMLELATRIAKRSPSLSGSEKDAALVRYQRLIC